MNNVPVVEVKNLSKTYNIRENSSNSIRQGFYNLFSNNKKRSIKALDNLNFEICKGEFIGVIGRNGSGKSTLLHLLMGSYKPDAKSTINIRGKMMRLALGLGFDLNLSARENIYLNGVILGLTFKEIGAKFWEIVDFAEIRDFVNTPLKYYSSGMRSRLSFSIAIQSKAEILLIDEFFGGVGDEKFKAKSKNVFENTFLDGRTIIFVSHDLNKIRKYSNRVLFLEKGKQLGIGDPELMIEKYKNSVSEN